MSSKLRKFMKYIPQFFTILGAVSVAFAMLLSLVNVPVQAAEIKAAAETCPDGSDGWVKVNVGDNPTFTYTAPGEYLIAEWCYKAGSNPLVFGDVIPPQKTVTLVSIYQQGISHASFRLIIPTPTNTPPQDETPTNTPVTPTPEDPTPTPVTPTPEDPTPTPVTPTPEDPTPTPVTPTPEDPTPTPVTPTPEDPTPTPVTPTPEDSTPTPVTPTPEDPTPTPSDPGTTPTPDLPEETPTPGDPTATPGTGETPDPTPQPTLPPPTSYDPPTILIPVTGMEIGNHSPLGKVQSAMFNMGLGFLGLGLVLQSTRKRLNF